MKKSLLIWFCSAATLCGAGQHPHPEKLADAIYRAEGGARAKVPYGILSVKVRDAAHARKICLVSIRNNWTRWERAGSPGSFIHFMADRWCPQSADPVGNANWKKNVTAIYQLSLACR